MLITEVTTRFRVSYLFGALINLVAMAAIALFGKIGLVTAGSFYWMGYVFIGIALWTTGQLIWALSTTWIVRVVDNRLHLRTPFGWRKQSLHPEEIKAYCEAVQRPRRGDRYEVLVVSTSSGDRTISSRALKGYGGVRTWLRQNVSRSESLGASHNEQQRRERAWQRIAGSVIVVIGATALPLLGGPKFSDLWHVHDGVGYVAVAVLFFIVVVQFGSGLWILLHPERRG